MKKVVLWIVVIAGLAFLGKKCSCSCSKESTVVEDKSSDTEVITDNNKQDKSVITGENGKEYKDYKEAVADGNFDAAYQFVVLMEKNEDDWDRHEAHDIFKQKTNSEIAKEYIFKEEVNFLAGQNSPEANKRIVLLLNGISKRGVSRPEGHLVAGDKSYINDWKYTDEEYNSYVSWCAEFNDMCKNIIDMAISLNNKDLAASMVAMVKPDATVIVKEKGGRYDIYAHCDTQSKDEVQKKYDEYFGDK